MGIVEYEQKVKKVKTSEGTYSGYFDGKNRSEKPLGFCHYAEHKGYISSDLLKKHKCLEKGCHFLSKYEDSPFFVDRARRNEDKKLKKQGVNKPLSPIVCCDCGKVFKACYGDTAVSIAKRARGSDWLVGHDNAICRDCRRNRRG